MIRLAYFRKKLLLTCSYLTVAIAASLFAENYTFGKGSSDWTIFIDPKSPDSVNLAANELSRYIELVTQKPVSITSDLGNLTKQTIYLGDTEFSRLKSIDTTKLPSDGFHIITTADGIAIAGKDYSGPPFSGTDNPYRINETYNANLKIGAFGDAGTLQGVYHFLRKYFGVRWYMPGDLGEVVPTKETVIVPSVDIERSPAFSYRYPYFCHFADSERDALWYRRAGFGAPFPVEINHSFERFLKYKDSNPEFFALIGGQRDFTTLSSVMGPGNLNLSDPGLLKAVIADINEYFDQDPSKMLFPLCPPDGMWKISEDPISQAQIDPSMGERGEFSDYVWGFINKVAAGVREKHPDKFVGCFAYEKYNSPPKNIARMEPNVVVMICKLRRKFPDKEYEDYVKELVTQWKTKTDHIYNWEYYCDVLFNGGWRGYPVFYPNNVQKDLQFLRGKSAGEMIEAESWTPDQAGDPKNTVINYPGLQHPLLYFTSQLLWDPEEDLVARVDEYYRDFYGPAHKEMRSFWETAEEAWMTKRDLIPTSVYNRETIQKMLGLLDAGIEATQEDSVYRKRIDLIKNEFAPAAIRSSRLSNLQKPSVIVSKVKETRPVSVESMNPIWEQGIPVLPFMDSSYDKPVPPTHLRLAWTEKGLKILLVCYEPHMGKIVSSASDRSKPDPAMWNDDSVEIFLRSDSDLKRTFHFAVNSEGAVYDSKNSTEFWQEADPGWNGRAEVAVRKEPKRWIAEISIPWSDLDIQRPQEGMKWTANFYRSRYAKGEREEFSWAPMTKGMYFAPEDFGEIILGN